MITSQNAAARFLKGCKKCMHVTPLLKDLPVNYRNEFKILLIVYKSLHNQMPSYLFNLLYYIKKYIFCYKKDCAKKSSSNTSEQ